MMARLRNFAAKLGAWLRRRKPDAGFDDEIRAHLNLLQEEYIRRGMTPDEAAWAARRRFGNTALLQEHRRELQTIAPLATIWRDLRYAARQLRRNPAFTSVAILSLALGIGVNTAIFSVLDAALLKLLPVRNPNELVMLTDPNASFQLDGLLTGERSLLTYAEFVELRNRATTMSGLCASGLLLERWPVRISGSPQEETRGHLVSENYFSVFGIEPAIGRFFTQQDATGVGKDPYAVISYDYWQRRFGGNTAVLGTPIRLYGATVVVIGVAAKGFRGETVGQYPDLWLPMMMQPLVTPGMDGLHEDLSKSQDKLMWLHVFGRRKAGVAIARVQAEVNVLFRGILEAGYPTTMLAHERREVLNQHVVVKPMRTGAFHGRDQFSKQWTILLALAALVLLIACANLANLLLARATTRSREVAIRLSIGAGKTRLIRQFLTESLLLAALGGIAGLLVASVASHILLLLLSDANNGFKLAVGLDLRVLGFTACMTLLTGILFGLAPAFRAVRTRVNESLKESGRGATSSLPRAVFTKALVIAQVALSLLLVMGAGLFLRTFWNLQSVDLGYPRENLLLVKVDSSGAGYQGARSGNLCHELAARIREIPGVRSMTYSDRGLFSGFEGAFGVTVEGFTPRNDDDRGSTSDFIGPEYFSTIGIPMLLGREIGFRDTANSPRVCVINEAFAKRFFSGRNPIGKHVAYAGDDTHRPSMEVVGVAKNARVHSLRGNIDPKFYAVGDQSDDWGSVTFEVRTTGDPDRMLSTVRKTILAVDANLPIESARTLSQLVEEQNAQPRLIAQLCTIFGILALVLAATGIYGVLSYGVARRTNEIGIRMALGAGKRQVIGMILKEAGLTITLGVAFGVAATIVTARLMATQLYGLNATGPRWSLANYQHVDSATQLYGIRAMDRLTIGVAIGILAAVALIAAYVPAARAARVDPVNALRHE
jgi:predicted permease